MSTSSTVALLKRRISTDQNFAKGLHQLSTTHEAVRFCRANGLDVTPAQLWTQRGAPVPRWQTHLERLIGISTIAENDVHGDT